MAPLLAQAQAAPQGKARLAFYLVDEAANDRLEEYLARRPAYAPRRKADGTYAVADAIIGAGRVVMEVSESGRAGRRGKLRYLVLAEGPALPGLAVVKASIENDPYLGTPGIIMKIGDYLDEDGNPQHGAEIFARITGDNVGDSLAVVFDNRVITYARIMESISGGEVRISGVDGRAAAEIIAVLNGKAER